MKNKNLIKIIGITILVILILTWIIPSSSTSTGSIVTNTIVPVGIADIFSSLEVILYYFSSTAVLILFVGMLYGVLNKTGVFKTITDKIVNIFKKRKYIFLILTVLFYSLIPALTGIHTQLIIFMPFTIAVLLALKYNKMQVLLATVGSTLIGLSAELSSNTYSSVTSITDNNYLWIKVGLLFVMIVLEVLYLLKFKNKKIEEEENKELMFIPEKRSIEGKTTKGVAALIIMFMLFILLILGCNTWNTEIFNNFHSSIENVKIGEFSIISSILGSTQAFGSWTNNSLYMIIGIAIILITVFEKMKFSDMIDACIEGAKKVSRIALISLLISFVVIFTLNSGFIITLINSIAKSGNIALITVSSLLSSPLMVEEMYSAQYLLQIFYTITSDDSLLEIYSLIGQITYGFTMLISPTSILLMIMLYYLGENYKNWFKYIWKLLLILLITCLIAITIATLI